MIPTYQQIATMRFYARQSQFDLSTLTGIDRSRLSLAEHGHIHLSAEQLIRIEYTLIPILEQQAYALASVISEAQARERMRHAERVERVCNFHMITIGDTEMLCSLPLGHELPHRNQAVSCTHSSS